MELQYHSPMCQMREMSEHGEPPADSAPGADPVNGRHERPGDRPFHAAARTTGPATALAFFRRQRGKIVLGLLVGASVFVIAAAYVVSTRPASQARPSAADRHQPAAAAAPTAAALPTATSSHSSRRPNPGPSHHPAAGENLAKATSPASSPASAPAQPHTSADTVLITFEDGTDGWSPFWGNLTDTTATSPAFDGTHSLLLSTSDDTYTAVGTTTDVAQLKTGDTVTYHVWSRGQSASLRPFIQDNGFTIIFAGSSNTPLPSSAGWFTLTWTVPATSSVKAIGLQVINPGSGSLTLAIGGLSWPSS